jgi:WD40 repeat protein
LAGGKGETIRIWRVADGAQVQSLDAHDNDVYGLAFSRDGRRLFSSSEDKTLIVWSLH